MMTDTRSPLFEQIPENFFSVLAGPLKELHAGLPECTAMPPYSLYPSRETIIDLFCEYLESVELQQWPEEDGNNNHGDGGDGAGSGGSGSSSGAGGSCGGDSDGQLPVQSIRERANLLFRKLVDAGWLNQEQHYDYTFKVSVPDYALAMMETLEKICTGYRMEFRGRVLSIYQNLTGDEGMSYVALQQAAEYTAELIDGLKRLSHSIKGYTEKLLEKKDPREIMSHIFDEYHAQVLGEQYYRLKTSEHISKYRTGILSRVREWQSNRPEILNQAARMVEERQAADRLTAENTLYDWLEFIEESFRHMDELLEEIDRRNVQYARSAVEKLRFQLQQGRGVGQHLATVLRELARRARGCGEYDEAPIEISGLIRLFPQRTVDEYSIKTPAQQSREHRPQPLELVEISKETRTSKLDRFRRRVQDEITVEEINRYVLSLIQDKKQLPLSEVPMHTREQWIKLIYILLFGRSRRARYLLGGEHGKTVSLLSGSVEVPALILERKDA